MAILVVVPVLAQQGSSAANEALRVTLRVTVTDSSGALVDGLPPTVFEIIENGKLQDLRSFKQGTAPASIGILFDNSASMRRRLAVLNRAGHRLYASGEATAHVRLALSRFLDYFPGEDNEFFLLVFGIRPELETGFTGVREAILEGVTSPSPDGRTALRDALQLALLRMDAASNPAKVLLVISDGGENRSKSKEEELRELVRKSDVSIYSIGVYGLTALTTWEQAGRKRFSWLARQSGGKYVGVMTLNGLFGAADRIGKELSSQYLLSYRPEVSDTPGWRDVEVRINLGDHRKEIEAVGAKLPLRAYTRASYYYTPSKSGAP